MPEFLDPESIDLPPLTLKLLVDLQSSDANFLARAPQPAKKLGYANLGTDRIRA
jgi:hypothetical protein